MGNDRLGVDSLDDDQLLAARSARDEPDGASADPQLGRDEAQQRLVGGPGDGGRSDVGAEDAVDHAVDMVRPGPGGQSDGEADVVVSQDSEQAPQDAQHDQYDERREVEHAGLGQDPADRSEDRLRGRDDEAAELAPAGRIDPRQEHATEDEQPDDDEGDLDEVAQEHEPSLAAMPRTLGG